MGSFFHNLPEVDLEITRGRAKSKLRRVESTVYLIGSAEDCDLVLGDTQFGQVHCYLLRTPEKVSIRRVGGGPEITIDGSHVDNATVRDGSRLRTGPYEFKLHVRWPAGHEGESTADVANDYEMESLDFAPALAIVGQLLADIRESVFPKRPGLSVFLPNEHVPVLRSIYLPIPTGAESPYRRAV